MNFLLTGANGFLGRTILDFFFKNGYKTSTLSRNKGSSYVKDIRYPFEFNGGEIFNAVVHIAGKAHVVPKTESEKHEFYQVNFEGTKNLCFALEKLNQLPKSFVYISTVAVYGIDEGDGITENRPLNGVSPYADSKIKAEHWLGGWASERKVNLTILRLPLIAGPNPPGNLGAMINGIRSGKYISISEANARKSVVWAADIAGIIPTLVEKEGTYNLTDGHHPTFGELEEAIASALKKRKPFKIPYWGAKVLALTGDVLGDRFPIDSMKLKKIISTLTFDDSKAKKELGWNPVSVLNKVAEIV